MSKAKNKGCQLSIFQESCPRWDFPCERCGRKLANQNRHWKCTVPAYYKWWYEDPLTGTTNPQIDDVIVNAFHTPSPRPAIATSDYGCDFFGSFGQSTPLRDGSLPLNEPQWVQDSGWIEAQEVLDPELNKWLAFARGYNITPEFIKAELDDIGQVIKRGSWKLTLETRQGAWYSSPPDTDPQTRHNHNIVPAEEYQETLLGFLIGVTKTVYPAPEGFVCPIPPKETTRFHRRIAPVPPIHVDDLFFEDLPDGYGWPPGMPTHSDPVDGPVLPIPFSGILYAPGFALGDYFGPPYIDVRHEKVGFPHP